MKRIEAVDTHLKICEELHALVMEENRILREEQRLPGAEISTRKEGLLQRLNESVAALKTADKATGGGPRLALARERSMQILRLDRENEQLLLRHSCTRRAGPRNSPVGRVGGRAQPKVCRRWPSCVLRSTGGASFFTRSCVVRLVSKLNVLPSKL